MMDSTLDFVRRSSTADENAPLPASNSVLDLIQEQNRHGVFASYSVLDNAPSETQSLIKSVYVNSPTAQSNHYTHVDANPLEIWEGRVEAIRESEGLFDAVLVSKLGRQEDHIAEIEISEVSSQDFPLLSLGAVFYLSVYKTITHGATTSSSEELRFRRLPVWSKPQIEQIRASAAHLKSKFRPSPVADD